MIKKLRFKLIAVSMLSLFLVLAIIIATVNILNYNERIMAEPFQKGKKGLPTQGNTAQSESPLSFRTNPGIFPFFLLQTAALYHLIREK